MLDVFLTVDVEVWCDGWRDLDARFPDAFLRHIHGRTPSGDFGLPFILRVLNDTGLDAVFFTEPLFATRFGRAPLEEVVGLLNEGRQEIQLHLHTEWVDEALHPLLPGNSAKRQHLFMFTETEQRTLIDAGLRLLTEAGATPANAFRAGSFGFNRDTLRALSQTSIAFDTSYNAAQYGLTSGVAPGMALTEPFECEGVAEYPLTVFSDGFSRFRNVQVTACSLAEMRGLLLSALEAGRQTFVLLGHSFELLNQSRNRPDPIAIGRFRGICEFLNSNRDLFNVRGFHNLSPRFVPPPQSVLSSPRRRTLARMATQAFRKVYR